jgi:RNA polymerase sigma-70 factor (ECF subfamily)
METSDETLVDLARSGDGDAFGALLSRHYDLIFRLGFRFLGNRTEAEDLAQDVCVSLAAKLRGYRGEAQFTTWRPVKQTRKPPPSTVGCNRRSALCRPI